MSYPAPLYTGRTGTFDPEFDTVYGITRDGDILAPDGLYAPDVAHDETSDITIDGGPTRARSHGDMDVNSGWDVLTGYTGQYGYRGAVMHPSEQWGAWALTALTDIADDDTFAYVAFAVVVVLDDDGEPIGWAVVYRGIPA